MPSIHRPSCDDQRPHRPHRPQGPATGKGHGPIHHGERRRPHHGNDGLLKAYAACRPGAEQLKLRNQVVISNLNLVKAVASRQGAAIPLPYDDRVQLGCLGLVRAVEQFDSRQGHRFSSFAVPYVLGAMRREWRDRGTAVRVPRGLWDLAERVHRLQERRRAVGLEALSDRAVACELGLPVERIREAVAASPRCRGVSLDGPAPGGHDSEPAPLLEALADPRSLKDRSQGGPCAASPRARTLWDLVQALPAEQCGLIIGRYLHGCTWVELGIQLGITARRAQRLCDRLVRQLQSDGQHGGHCGLQSIH